jgi:hypothetical protein
VKYSSVSKTNLVKDFTVALDFLIDVASTYELDRPGVGLGDFLNYVL